MDRAELDGMLDLLQEAQIKLLKMEIILKRARGYEEGKNSLPKKFESEPRRLEESGRRGH